MLISNTRRPVIWNRESLKIAKKLNFKEIKLEYNTKDNHIKLNEIMKKFIEFIRSNDFLVNIFTINNKSFWSIFESDFIVFCEKRFSEILFFIDSLEELSNKEDIKLLITLDDSQQIGRTATMFYNKIGIPTILSLNTDINIFYDQKRNWEVFTLYKIYADKFAIYGNLSKQICLDHKVDSNKLVITGNPRYDELFNRKVRTTDNYILITLSGIASTAWSTFFSSLLILKYENMFKEVLNSLSKYKKNVVIKLHPTQDSVIDVKGIVNEILPHAQIYKNANTYDLISNAELVISPSSSVITEALILDKPVFLFKFLANDSGIPYEKYNAVLATESINEIGSKIEHILFDKNIRRDLEVGRKRFLEHVLEYQGNSSEEIIKLVKSLTNSI